MGQVLEFAGNHPFLAGAIIIAVVLVVINEARLRMRELAVSPFDAVRLVNQGAAVVDLRSAEQFSASRIADATNVQPNELAGHVAGKIKARKSILLVCDNGSESARCATAIRKVGRENAFSLKGGLAAWQQENLPTVGDTAANDG